MAAKNTINFFKSFSSGEFSSLATLITDAIDAAFHEQISGKFQKNRAFMLKKKSNDSLE
jgi:hypothetical protein